MLLRKITRSVTRKITSSILSTPTSKKSFTPAELFALGELGMWFDPSDLSSMFQDAAGTIPVTAANQQVGKILDKSGRGNHATQSTGASRPILRNSGAIWFLEFDGVNDFLVTGNASFTVASEMSVLAGVGKITDAAAGTIAEFGSDVTTANGSFALMGPDGASATYSGSFRGTATQKLTASGYAAPVTNVVSSICSLAFSQILRVSGVQVTGGNLQGDTNFGNYPLYIGMRAGASLPFKGYLAGLIVRADLTDPPILGKTEAWLAGKSGL